MAVREAVETAELSKGMSWVDVALEQLAANIEARQIAKAQKRDRDEREWAKEIRFSNQHLAELEGELQTGTTVNIAIGAADQNMGVAVAVLHALRDEPAATAESLARPGPLQHGAADARRCGRARGAGDRGLIRATGNLPQLRQLPAYTETPPEIGPGKFNETGLFRMPRRSYRKLLLFA